MHKGHTRYENGEQVDKGLGNSHQMEHQGKRTPIQEVLGINIGGGGN